MATQVICDRCKNVINNYHTTTREYGFYHNGRELDLCRKCYLDTVRFIEAEPSFSRPILELDEQEKEN